MTSPEPVAVPDDEKDPRGPEFSGPYYEGVPGYMDPWGHVTNGDGRCRGLNAQPPTCPPAED